jgi:hypothetical protein
LAGPDGCLLLGVHTKRTYAQAEPCAHAGVGVTALRRGF